MNQSLDIALALIKRNKRTHLFIAIIFIVCLTGLVTSFSVMQTTANVFDKKADELESAHIFRILSNKNANIKELENYFIEQPMVDSFQIQPSSEPFYTVEIPSEEDVLAFFVETPIKKKHDFLQFIEGESKKEPDTNEVWITSGFANNHQIKVGDTLGVVGIDGKSDYSVSAIVYDPLFVSGLMNPTRMWVKSGQLSLLFGTNQLENYSITIRLTDRALVKEFMQDFNVRFPNLQFVYSVSYETLKATSNLLMDMIGSGIFLVSMLLILISVSIIFFIVSGEIIRDYAIYGVYKGLGFSLRQIKNINYYKYAILILTSYPISLTLSFFITKLILSAYEQSTGAGYLEPKLVYPSIISILLICVIVLLTIFFASRKLRNLKPAAAIRFGYQPKIKPKKIKERISSSFIQMLTLKELLMYPLKNSIKVIIITGLAILVFSISMVYDIISVFFTPEVTLGIPECKIYLQTNGKHFSRPIEFILHDLEKEEGVEKIIPLIFTVNNYYLKDGERISLMGHGYKDFDDHGLKVIKGRNPQLPNEVAITPTLSKISGKGIGDKIALNIGGAFQNLTVTGIYQLVANDGKGFRAIKETFYQSNPETEDSWFTLTLAEGIDVEQMRTQLTEHYGGDLTINLFDEFLDNTAGGINRSIAVLSSMLILVMAMICFIALYNLIWIHVIENKKHYGVFKSVGMSNKELLQIQLLKMSVLTGLSCLLAIFFSIFIAPNIIISLLSYSGITEINLSLSILRILIACVLIFLLTIVSTTLAVKSQKSINLRQLIIE